MGIASLNILRLSASAFENAERLVRLAGGRCAWVERPASALPARIARCRAVDAAVAGINDTDPIDRIFRESQGVADVGQYAVLADVFDWPGVLRHGMIARNQNEAFSKRLAYEHPIKRVVMNGG